MAKPDEPADSKTSVPQFDRAEFAEKLSHGPSCRECGGPIRDEYYDVDGNVICTACHAKMARRRRRWIRAFKALLLGTLAAVIGAGVYRLILFGTGWNFSLVAILVGYTVGGAVRSGSGDRGGRFYQFLAVFLTYSALVGMFLPDFWETLSSSPAQRRGAREKIEKTAREEAKTDPGRKVEAKAGTETKPAAPDLKNKPAGVGAKPRPQSMLYLIGMLVLIYLLMIGLVISFPVVVAFHSPISLFIFGAGLWQAWRMNVGNEVVITGPYRVRG